MIHSVSPTPLRRRRQSFSPELPPPRLFYWKVVGLWGKGKNFFPGKKPNVGTEVSLPPYPQPLLKKRGMAAPDLSRHSLWRRRIVAAGPLEKTDGRVVIID